MGVKLQNGWLSVPFPGGDEVAPCYIGVSDREEPTEWTPAYLDWEDGVRVAKVRPPTMSSRSLVWLKVAGQASTQGRVDRDE